MRRRAPHPSGPSSGSPAILEARLAEGHVDGITHYNLGRAHAFAFALERSSLWAIGSEEIVWVNDLDTQRRWASDWQPLSVYRDSTTSSGSFEPGTSSCSPWTSCPSSRTRVQW